MNPQPIIDWPVDGRGRRKDLPDRPGRPCSSGSIDGRSLGLALTPLGAIDAAFYAREARGGAASARLLFNLEEK